MWTNYHGHCHFDDGSHTIDEHAFTAIDQNIKYLGLSCHSPVPFQNSWSTKKEDLPKYFDEIRATQSKLGDKLQLLKSLEIDFIPDVVTPTDAFIKDLELDYTVGSVHFVGKLPEGRPCEIDGSHDIFLKGLHETFQGKVKNMVSAFFSLTREMVKNHCPDIIGHLDKIKMQNRGLWNETDQWYKKEIHETLDAIKKAGAVVEINTRGMYKGYTHEPYPSYDIIAKMDKTSIPMCINSDAHQPKELTLKFEDTASQLIQLGIKNLHYYNGKVWQATTFSPATGLHLI